MLFKWEEFRLRFVFMMKCLAIRMARGVIFTKIFCAHFTYLYYAGFGGKLDIFYVQVNHHILRMKFGCKYSGEKNLSTEK